MLETARALSEEPGTFWTNQLHNPDTIPGYAALGEEIWEQAEGRRVVTLLADSGLKHLDTDVFSRR